MDVAGLGIEGPVCFRGPPRAECDRAGCRVVVAVRELVLVDVAEAATDFARLCALVVVLPVFDVVVPPDPTFLVSGACVVLFERESSVARLSYQFPQSLPSFFFFFFSHLFDVRGKLDDCLAIVPGCMRPERALAKAGLASFNPPGTRARAGALDCTCNCVSQVHVRPCIERNLPYSRRS